MRRRSLYDMREQPDLYADIEPYDLAELRDWECEVIYNKKACWRKGAQRHHGLVRRDKRHKELDVLINYQNVCPTCHTDTGHADSKENHVAFYKKQCERYGKEVDNWIDALPFKVKLCILKEEQ